MSTHSIANIIVASANHDDLTGFTKDLEQHNYTVLKCDDTGLDTKSKTAHPDLIVVDVSSDKFDGFAAILKIKSSPETAHIPVVALAAEKTDELYERAIEVCANDIFIHSLKIEEFIAHIQALLRLSTMFMELDNRVTLAKEYNIEASNEVDVENKAPYTVLLVAPKDGDKAALTTVLDGNCNIDVCNTVFEAEDILTNGFYDACICHYDKSIHDAVLSLSARVRNNPRLFNLPMLVMCADKINDRMEAYRRGVTRIIDRPLNLHTLKAKLKMLVRRQRLRWALRNAIEKTKASKNSDAKTNAYSRDFFEKNLDCQIKNAHTWQKNLTVVFFSIPNIESLKVQFDTTATDHLLQQTHQWIAGLVRIEDMVARFGDHEFCVALPDTPVDEAQIVMHRIAGILSYTDFALPDVFQPISVWVETGITGLELGDDRDILIKRARHNIQ
ncbi:MAG: diguanylate cyclase [Methylocystaceae bacterium]|nr:diguanylate cyclase [Methylocystaceae bacterium]